MRARAAQPKKPISERQKAHLVKARIAASESGKSGRPSTYKSVNAHVARLMCRNGAVDAELADAFGVSTTSICRWQVQHPDFAVALRVGKGEYDDRVERALAQRAIGYSYDTEKIFMPHGAKKAIRVPYREHIPPDPIAALKWLVCRRMKEWRDRKELTGADGGPLAPIVELLNELDGKTVRLVERALEVHDVRTNGNRRPSYTQSEGPA